MERSTSLPVERCEISGMMRPNAVNYMHSASRLRKYRLHDREKSAACVIKRSIVAALPTIIIFASLSAGLLVLCSASAMFLLDEI